MAESVSSLSSCAWVLASQAGLFGHEEQLSGDIFREISKKNGEKIWEYHRIYPPVI